MENQQPHNFSPNQQPLDPQPAQPPATPQTFMTPPPTSGFSQSKPTRPPLNRKKWITFSILLTLFALIGAAVAYIMLIYIPNRPEVVLQKAVETYVNDKAAYTISGKLDNAGPNDPDFTYTVQTNAAGSAKTELNTSTFLQSPRVETIKAGDKLYVNFGGFQDFKTMATHYRNVGKPGIQEAIAAFAESSGVAGNQNKWLQVDDFILEQPAAPKSNSKRIPGIPGAKLSVIGAEETVNGKKTRKYEVTLDPTAFKLLAGHIDMNAGVPILSGIMADKALGVTEVKLSVWVNLETKTIEQVTYDGRPFEDATFSVKIVANNQNNITAPSAELLTSKLGYGIVNKIIFNKALQQGEDDADKERIADMKGIKTALEIYKNRAGHYPERYEMSVNQEGFIASQMPGADIEVFKDPANALIGRSGSQYAYVPALKSDDQNCGKFSAPCEKFFIVTTLNNGQKYQLNSN